MSMPGNLRNRQGHPLLPAVEYGRERSPLSQLKAINAILGQLPLEPQCGIHWTT